MYERTIDDILKKKKKKKTHEIILVPDFNSISNLFK